MNISSRYLSYPLNLFPLALLPFYFLSKRVSTVALLALTTASLSAAYWIDSSLQASFEKRGLYRRALSQVPLLSRLFERDRVEDLRYLALTVGCKDALVDKERNPSTTLREIFRRLGNEQTDSFGSLYSFTEAHLMQGSKNATTYELLPLFDELGFLDSRKPLCHTYDGALIYGDSPQDVDKRLQFLIKEWEKGIRFPTLYFLSQDLSIDFESMVPENMRRELTITSISAKLDGAIRSFMRLHLKGGSFLAISNAPYLLSHDLLAHTLLPKSFRIDTAGSGADGSESMETLLDGLGRVIVAMVLNT